MAHISNIERIWVDLPLKEVPGRNMVREIPHWTIVEVCKVTLDTGHVGIGETTQFYTWGTVEEADVRRAWGRNPAELMWDDSLGAGLQMACFDAVGKLLGVPVWALLGTQVRDRAHLGWWAIDMPAEDWISECGEALCLGYTTLKTKARPWFDLEDQVERLVGSVPDWFKIDLDFNDFGLDPAVAKPLCRRLERWPQIAIWESPIQQEDVAGNRELRRHLAVPLAQHIGRPALTTQLREEMCDGFVLEGGVSRAVKHGRICAEFNKPFWLQWVGTNLSATMGLHLQAVLSHARWPAIHCHHLYAAQVVNEPIHVANGMAEVPSSPGLGVTLDEDIIEKYRIEPKEKPYPYPGLLLRLDWPTGARTYFTHAGQMWEEFQAGRLPAFTKGVNLTRIDDDGSDEWRQFYARAELSPVNVS